jgi:hypothetical protein
MSDNGERLLSKFKGSVWNTLRELKIIVLNNKIKLIITAIDPASFRFLTLTTSELPKAVLRATDVVIAARASGRAVYL